MSVSPDELVDHLIECLAFNGDEGKRNLVWCVLVVRTLMLTLFCRCLGS